MVTVREQYDAYPYPARDPEEERTRLVTGSPSDPVEIDHFLHAGRRDWRRGFRALVAGGGTGDGLVMLAQRLADAGVPFEITYVDLSVAARRIAEARVAVRGLTGIRFETGSLLDAPDLGQFDYIDCCGVLHHLPDPAAGFRALRAALAPGGGIGVMVYAPYGRSGVYPLQEAFGALFAGLPPAERVARAKPILARLPDGHPFRRNPHLGDHQTSDAGLYDLLLHGQDRAFDVAEFLALLAETGWRLQSFTMPGLYDLSRFAEAPPGLGEADRMALAEKLSGSIKTHVAYLVPDGDDRPLPDPRHRALVPHLVGGDRRRLAEAVAAAKPVSAIFGGQRVALDLPKAAAGLMEAADGQRTLTQIAAAARIAPDRAASLWTRLHAALIPWGMLRYSGLRRP